MALTGSNMCLKVSKNPKKITNPSAPLKNLRSHQQYIRSFYNWCISEAWHCTPGSEFFTVHLTWGLFLPRPEMSKRQLATTVVCSYMVELCWKSGHSLVNGCGKQAVGGFPSGLLRGSLSQLEKARPGSQATLSAWARLLPSGKRSVSSPVTAAKSLHPYLKYSAASRLHI
jgi:hypothetical protein